MKTKLIQQKRNSGKQKQSAAKANERCTRGLRSEEEGLATEARSKRLPSSKKKNSEKEAKADLHSQAQNTMDIKENLIKKRKLPSDD